MSRITRSLRSANSSTRADGRLQQEELPTLRRDYNFLRSDIIDDDIDFTRNSGATQTNSSGLVAFAPENLVTYTDDFSNSQDRFTYRSGHSISFTANQTDPNGGTDAALFANVTGTSANDFWKQVLGIGANAPYIPSFFIKKVSTTGTLKLANPSGGTSEWRVDMSKLPDGWVRITPSHSAVTIITPFTAHSNGSGGIWFRSHDGTPLSFYLAFPQVERTFDNSSSGEPLDFIENKTGNALFKERFDHVPGTGERRGLLIEEARTNLFLNSDTNTWVQGLNNDSVIRLDNYAISPSGVKDAPKFITTSNNVLKIISPSVAMPTIGTSTLFTFSCFVKKGNTDYVRMYHNDSTSFGVVFNLATGQVHSTTNNGDSNIEDYGNGWYRCWYSHTTPSTHSVGSTYIYPTDENGTITHANEWSVHLWQGQVELGGFPTSLVPTRGSTSTRAADIVNVTGTNFSRFFKDTEGTFVIDIQMPKGWKDAIFNYFFSASDNGSNSHRINFYGRPDQTYLSGHIQSGSAVDVNLSTVSTIDLDGGEISRHAIAYKEDDGRYSGDGDVFAVTDTSVTLPVGIDRLDIGQRYIGSQVMTGWFRRLRYFNKRKSDAQVQKLTDTSFLLDKFKGAKAAHSLRSLRDGRDSSPVCSVRREYDNFESSYSAAQVSNGDLEKDFRSADQTTLPLNISCEADEMIVGGDFTDMVTNGGFDTDSDWTKTNATIGSGVATVTVTSGGFSSIKQNLTYVSGRQYTVCATVNGTAGNTIRFQDNTSNTGGLTSVSGQVTLTGSDQKVSFTFTANSTSDVISVSRNTTSGNYSFTVDNVSVVEGEWTATNAVISFSDNVLTVDDTANAGTDSGAYQNITTQAGKTYTLSFDKISTTSIFYYHLSNALINGSALSGAVSLGTTAGNFTTTFVATSSTSVLKLISGGTGVTKFDNVSVKEVNPIATGFSTRKINSDYTGYAMRVRNNDDNIEAEVSFDSNNEISLDSPVKATSMNLLAYSEDFSSWSNDSTIFEKSTVTDPFGGTNAWKLTADSSVSSGPYLSGVGTANTWMTLSVYVKAVGETRTRIGWWRSSNADWVNVETNWSAVGTPTTHATTNSFNVNYEAIGTDGWYRVSLTGQAASASGQSSVNLDIDSENGNRSVIYYGAMLEETVYEDTGTEKVTNGTFDTDLSSWVKSDASGNETVEFDNGRVLMRTVSGDYIKLEQAITFEAGKQYTLSGDVSYVSGSGVVAYKGSTLIADNLNSTTTFSFTTTQATTASELFRITRKFISSGTASASEVYLDNLSVLEYDPIVSDYVQTPVISDAHNSTSATNLREFAGKENLLSYSEDFSQSIYSKINSGIQDASQIVDPFGGNNAVRLAADTTNAQHRLDIPTSVGTEEHTLSVYAKAAEYGSIWLRRQGSSSTFNLENGTVISDAGNNNPTITPVGNDGWYRVSITNTGSANDTFRINFAPTATPTSDYAGDGTSGIYIFGAQLNTNSLKDYQKTEGTAKTADVNVVNWYDQGGGEDFTQSTAGEQPRIVMGSELVTDSGGKASVYFDGGDTLDNNTLAGQNRLDSYFIQDTTDTQYIYPSGTNNSLRFGLTALDGSNAATESNYGTPSYYVNGALQSFADRDDSHDALTGSTKLLSQHNASTGAWTGFTVGHYHNGSTAAAYNFTGKISEMVFFPNMDSSPKRFPIEQNMMNHYIPNLLTNGDFSDGLTGWVAGGDSSLISVENGAIRINSPDSTFTQIYQTVPVTLGRKYVITADLVVTSGGVAIGANHNSAATEVTYTSSGSISQSFVATTTSSSNTIYIKRSGASNVLIDNVKVQEVGTSGYVTTLYDQTGNNNHALQDTAAYQPQLVSGGDLIKSGGHPAWEFKNNNPYHVLNLHGKIQAAHLDAWFVHDTSDPIFLYPGNYLDGNDFGWVAQDGSSSTSNSGGYGFGNAKLYVNGDLIGSSGSKTRDELHTALSGRKLVHHQDSDTADWSKLMMGWYAEGPAQGSSIPYGFTGKFSEWIWFDSDESSNRTSIDTALNNYYNIYS